MLIEGAFAWNRGRRAFFSGSKEKERQISISLKSKGQGSNIDRCFFVEPTLKLVDRTKQKRNTSYLQCIILSTMPELDSNPSRSMDTWTLGDGMRSKRMGILS